MFCIAQLPAVTLHWAPASSGGPLCVGSELYFTAQLPDTRVLLSAFIILHILNSTCPCLYRVTVIIFAPVLVFAEAISTLDHGQDVTHVTKW